MLLAAHQGRAEAESVRRAVGRRLQPQVPHGLDDRRRPLPVAAADGTDAVGEERAPPATVGGGGSRRGIGHPVVPRQVSAAVATPGGRRPALESLLGPEAGYLARQLIDLGIVVAELGCLVHEGLAQLLVTLEVGADGSEEFP